jgi:hypothetical protein
MPVRDRNNFDPFLMKTIIWATWFIGILFDIPGLISMCNNRPLMVWRSALWIQWRPPANSFNPGTKSAWISENLTLRAASQQLSQWEEREIWRENRLRKEKTDWVSFVRERIVLGWLHIHCIKRPLGKLFQGWNRKVREERNEYSANGLGWTIFSLRAVAALGRLGFVLFNWLTHPAPRPVNTFSSHMRGGGGKALVKSWQLQRAEASGLSCHSSEGQ